MQDWDLCTDAPISSKKNPLYNIFKTRVSATASLSTVSCPLLLCSVSLPSGTSPRSLPSLAAFSASPYAYLTGFILQNTSLAIITVHQNLSQVWQELLDTYNDWPLQARTTRKQATTKRHICSRRTCLQPEPHSFLRNSTQHLQQKSHAQAATVFNRAEWKPSGPERARRNRTLPRKLASHIVRTQRFMGDCPSRL